MIASLQLIKLKLLTPELQWNLRARYDFTIGTYPAYWQFGTKFSDDSYSSIVAQRRIKQDSYQLYDLAVGIENETWGAELFGRNLSDERAELFYNEMDDVPRVTTNRPRNIGLRVFYKF
ncbi:MAG: TonB-dependent receptor [Proteobacteria bacterium]|nr:TonB-dependent receptor [Pseudomonadota bacterium]